MSQPEIPMVKAEAVSKAYGSKQVLKSISLEVKRGEVLCLVGPSGSGKSTFLRCINHLEVVNAGRLTVDGVLVGYEERGDKLYELKPKEAARQRRNIGGSNAIDASSRMPTTKMNTSPVTKLRSRKICASMNVLLRVAV